MPPPGDIPPWLSKVLDVGASVLTGIVTLGVCEALSVGIGTPACLMLSGTAASGVGYLLQTAGTGNFTWAGFGEATGTGAMTAWLGGELFSALGTFFSDASGGAIADTAGASIGDASGDAAGDTAGGAAGDTPQPCSFTADTPVLLADGSTLAISAVAAGTAITATDPSTGITTSQTVSAVWEHQDQIWDVTLADGTLIHTTANHPWWDVTTHTWTRTDHLTTGDQLATSSGGTITISQVQETNQTGATYNLTITGPHTYYVSSDFVLVHNCPINDSTSQDEPTIPSDTSQTDHIFGDRPGHVPDTPANRQMLVDTASDQSNFQGTDQWGNDWYAQTQSDGSQVWVSSRNGVIQDGGVNLTPRTYNPQTGLSSPVVPGR